jgi:hypothetical protein
VRPRLVTSPNQRSGAPAPFCVASNTATRLLAGRIRSPRSRQSSPRPRWARFRAVGP